MKIIKNCVASIALILIVCLTYRNVVNYPFTNWDDIKYISQNPVLKKLNVNNVVRIFTPGAIPDEVIYIPFTYLSFLIERSLFGQEPTIVHRTNLILHVFNVLLVFKLLSTIGRNNHLAGIGALIFAIHPIQVEAVAWCMGRKDLLSSFFALLAILAFYQYARDGCKKYYVVSVILFVFGLLSKPSLITLPLIFLLVHVYVHKSFKINELWKLAPFVVLSILCLWMNQMAIDHHSRVMLPLKFRIMCISLVIFGWGKRMLLLEKPELFYCWPEAVNNLPMLHLGICFLIAIFVILLYFQLKKQNSLNEIQFGLIFFIIAFLPAAGVVIETREFMTADRYGYFPVIGILISCVCILAVNRNRLLKQMILIILSGWILYGFFVTKSQIRLWQNSISIWSHIIEKCPNLLTAYNNLGMAYINGGKTEKGIAVFKQGLNADPSYINFYNNLGKIYFESGKLEEAKSLLLRGLGLDPENGRTLKNLGDVYRNLGDFDHAERYYKNAVTANKDYISAYLVLGDLYLKQKRYAEAEAMFLNVADRDPENPSVYYNLALIYESKGHIEDAISYYQAAIDLNPRYWETHYNLGNLYFANGSHHHAEEEYLNTVALNQSFIQAQINLGSVYLHLNQLDKAESVYLGALQIDSNQRVGIHYNLGLLYLKKNELNSAIMHLQNSLLFDDNFGAGHYQLAKVYWHIGKYEDAFIHCTKAAGAGIIVDRHFLIELSQKQEPGYKGKTIKQ